MLMQTTAAKKMIQKRMAQKTAGLWGFLPFGCRMMGTRRGPPSQHDITAGLDHRLARALEGRRNAVDDCRYGSRAGRDHRLARALEGRRHAVDDCRYGSRAGLDHRLARALEGFRNTVGDCREGVNSFLLVAEANKSKQGFMCCPCLKCKNEKDYSCSRDIKSHLLRFGFMSSYNVWTKHGEEGVMMEDGDEEEDNDDQYRSMFSECNDTAMDDNEEEGGEEGIR
ncbi:hypothetical protein QYE76_057064 [Lolium multiflorum]|uniref:Transposase-associated domain-containing protein n=1 Tax=Lolium multiflorum TaxID=4521 RepID=A0AAD8WR36_LOLMU|nr:hypothetical protein QYE76_057064 [Lolium multiflorum]